MMSVKRATSLYLKVTVTAASSAGGYGIDIASIDFRDNEAVVNYRTTLPDIAATYPAGPLEVSAVTYIPASYKPVLGSQQAAEPAPDHSANPDTPVSAH
jgi:hypothetical protein